MSTAPLAGYTLVKMPPPLFAISHAHANRMDPSDTQLLKKFVTDLIAAVFRTRGATNQDELAFIDYEDVQTGDMWNETLTAAFQAASVGVALYSPHYFNSEWCGREYQLFLDRASNGAASSGIIPVLWIPAKNMAESARPVQYADGDFPDAYKEVGLLKLMKLQSYQDAYVETIDRLAELIDGASNPGLRTIAPVTLNLVKSAWQPGVGASPIQRISGSVSKTCFVYLSNHDWQWKPYSNGAGINAMALRIASDLDVEFERIACDYDVINALKNASDHNIPTVLLGDPDAINTPVVANALRGYDQLMLSNCGALFAWPSDAERQLDTRPEWNSLYNFCRNKIDEAKPNHEWRTIFSPADLESKTRAIVEAIRLRLLQRLTGPGSTPLRAESQQLTEAAARQGYALHVPPQIGSV